MRTLRAANRAMRCTLRYSGRALWFVSRALSHTDRALAKSFCDSSHVAYCASDEKIGQYDLMLRVAVITFTYLGPHADVRSLCLPDCILELLPLPESVVVQFLVVVKQTKRVSTRSWI